MNVVNYFMMDAAVAIESYQNIIHPIEMRHPDWDRFYFGSNTPVRFGEKSGRKLWPTEWYEHFKENDADTTNDDYRINLTWTGKFKDTIVKTNLYNFYSTGEEVLQQDIEGKPNSLEAVVGYLPFFTSPGGVNAWSIQEKSKGTGNLANFLSKPKGTAGWGFKNSCSDPGYELDHLIACLNVVNDASNLTIEQIKIEPYFADFDNVLIKDPQQGSTQAFINFPYTMGYEIPALSFAAGSTRFPNLQEGSTQFDMNGFPTIWPNERGGINQTQWRHSDYKNISFLYAHKLYTNIVELGALR